MADEHAFPLTKAVGLTLHMQSTDNNAIMLHVHI